MLRRRLILLILLILLIIINRCRRSNGSRRIIIVRGSWDSCGSCRELENGVHPTLVSHVYYKHWTYYFGNSLIIIILSANNVHRSVTQRNNVFASHAFAQSPFNRSKGNLFHLLNIYNMNQRRKQYMRVAFVCLFFQCRWIVHPRVSTFGDVSQIWVGDI